MIFYFFILSFLPWIQCENTLQVVNGDEVVPHSLPYVVAISTIINDTNVRCGGSLIKKNTVLTAASCLNGTDKAIVTLGAHNIDIKEDSQIIIESSKFVIHDEYDPETRINDIAVIYLPDEIPLSENIATISTPELVDVFKTYADDLGLVAGWGKFNDTNPNYSNVLRKIEATIIPWLSCTIPYIFKVQTSQICTTGVQNNKNICRGDTGSPLVVNGTQVGIASYGSDLGCSIGLPGVYTRLTSFILWLASK